MPSVPLPSIKSVGSAECHNSISSTPSPGSCYSSSQSLLSFRSDESPVRKCTTVPPHNSSMQKQDNTAPAAATAGTAATAQACNWDKTQHLHYDERLACCRSEVGRKCYSLPNRYKSCNIHDQNTQQPLYMRPPVGEQDPCIIDHHPDTANTAAVSNATHTSAYHPNIISHIPSSTSHHPSIASHEITPNYVYPGCSNHHNSANSAMPHELFHHKLASIKTWYRRCSDVQRNRILTELLEDCRTSQIHLLSLWLCGDGRVTIDSPNSHASRNYSTTTDNTYTTHANMNTTANNRNSSNPTTSNRNIDTTPNGRNILNSTTSTRNNERNTNATESSSHPNTNASNGSLEVDHSSNSSINDSIGTSTSTSTNNSTSDSTHSNIICANRLSLLPGQSRIHLDCPANCQDPLSVLPIHVSHKILSLLDPQSLARAIQVCRVWRWVCSSSVLWQRLTSLPRWRLPPASHRDQLAKHTLDHTVNWKEVVVERWRVRRNWLGAHCHVRTFAGHTEGVTCVQFDQHKIVSASHDNTIKVWSMRTNSQWPVQTLVGHSGRVRCLHLNNNRLVSGAADAAIKVWEVEETSEWSSIVCRLTLLGHTATVRCLQVCCGGSLVVSGSYDCTVRVWRLSSGRCELTLRGHGEPVLSLAVVEEETSTLIVSGSADNTIKVWRLNGPGAGECVRTLTGHTDAVTSLSADTLGVISGSLDSTIRSWDLHTGRCLNTLDWITSEGHTGVVRCVAADESRVVSASDDKTIKVWERSSLRRLVTLRCHTDGVTCLAFNHFLIVSGSYDKTVKLWDFSVC